MRGIQDPRSKTFLGGRLMSEATNYTPAVDYLREVQLALRQYNDPCNNY